MKCSLILSFETLALLYFASRIRPQRCMLGMSGKVKFPFERGAVEVHSLGDTTVNFFWCFIQSDKVVAKRTQLSRAAFLCLGKGAGHGNCAMKM